MTQFADWLAAHHEAPWQYSLRHGINRYAVYLLAGHGHPQATTKFSVEHLKFVSRDTGIPIGELVEDAIAAMYPEETRDAEEKEDRGRQPDSGGAGRRGGSAVRGTGPHRPPA